MDTVQWLGLQGPWECRVRRGAGGRGSRSYGAFRVFFPSLWQLCCSEDLARRWRSCLDHGDLGGTNVQDDGSLRRRSQGTGGLLLASGGGSPKGLPGWGPSLWLGTSGI